MISGGQHSGRGTAQVNRLVAALLPDSIKVDERSFTDLLAIVSRFAEMVQYYNLENEPVDSWLPFFSKDVSFFLANLLTEDPVKWDEEVHTIIRKMYQVYLPEDKTQLNKWLQPKKKLLVQLFTKVRDLAALLNDWYVRSISLDKLKQTTEVTPILEKAIENHLGAHFQLLNSRIKSIQKEIGRSIRPIDQNAKGGFHAIWFKEYHTDSVGLPIPKGSTNDRINFMIEELRQTFEQLYQTMVYILDRVPLLLEESLSTRNDHQPDTGLIMAFLKTFGYAQEHLNQLTRRHLDHYYLERLCLRKKTPIVDWSVVSFRLADQGYEHFLPAQTRILAGVNGEGLESHYQTDTPVLISPASIAVLKTLFISKYRLVDIGSSYRLVSGVFAAPAANSQDGQGAPFLQGEAIWPAFGEEQMDKASDERFMENASIGWAIASPVLALSQGYRNISLRMKFTPESFGVITDLVEDLSQNREMSLDTVIHHLFSNTLQFFGTGPEGWFAIEKVAIKKDGDSWLAATISFELSLSLDDPALVENAAVVLEPPFSTHLPTIKISLIPDESTYIYSFLQYLVLEEIQIEAEVVGLKTLNLINEAGPVDNAAPFSPFGPIPRLNSYLMIGHVELFKKRLEKLNINLEWNNLPVDAEGFKAYFSAYSVDPPIDNYSFKFHVSALSSHYFKPLAVKDQQELNVFSATVLDGPLDSAMVLDEIDLERLAIHPNYRLQELVPYTNQLDTGYLKLQLSEPAMMFGHQLYPNLFTEAMLANAQPKLKEMREVPREPFNPVLRQISIDYKASSTIYLEDIEFRKNEVSTGEKIFHIHPFGVETVFVGGRSRNQHLIPRFDHDGYLYIGLKDLHPPQPLTLFFAMQESKKRFNSADLEIEWSVLYQDQWISLGQDEILSDGTDRFTSTGIISLDLPASMSQDNNILDAGLHWLRISAKGDLDIVGGITAIVPHAAQVSWIDNGDAEHFSPSEALPELKQLVKQIPEIASLHQEIPFQGRYPLESNLAFYIRASERLRHKNRAIQIWDWERLVLEQFPFLQQVKCIGVLGNEENYELKPGTIKMVVVPRIDGKDKSPKVGFRKLKQIEKFLEEHSSPFVDINVVNPQYERLKVSCSILLQKDLYTARGKYLKQLQEDLQHHICPWLTNGSIDFGGQIAKNEILSFIKSRPYVRYVSRFSLVQVYEKIFERESRLYELEDTAIPEDKLHLIQATTPWSVLIPVEEHGIHFLKNEHYLLPEITAIDNMQLGTDFIVVEGKESDELRERGLMDLKSEPPEEEWFVTL